MVNYLLTPLCKHYDLGFGFTGNKFRNAAKCLVEKKDEFYFGDVPVSYLQRHAIELYLKSAIIILYKLEGNSIDANNNNTFPNVVSSGRHKSMFSVHSIGDLCKHLINELSKLELMLKEKSKISWDFSSDFMPNIIIIEKNDPSSTFFRYPVTKEKGDEIKSHSEESSTELLLGKINSGSESVKAFLVIDGDDNVVNAYELRKTMDEEVSSALSQVLEELFCFHAAMRGELTGGW